MIQRALALSLGLAVLVAGPAAQVPGDPGGPTDAADEQVDERQKVALRPGDPAPPLLVRDWLKGRPVERFERGKVYVVEFWATWCVPCESSMPHLTAMQRRYAKDGLTVVGVSTEERRTSLAKVREMVARKGPVMDYTVAWDAGQRSFETWMKAAGKEHVPTTFLVDREGRIAWIGHPTHLDVPVAEVIAGTWDLVRGPSKMRAIRAHERKIYISMESDPGKALELFEELAQAYPAVGQRLSELHFSLLVRVGRGEAAAELGKKLLSAAEFEKDARKLNRIAWTLVDPETRVKDRNLELALVAARKAVELTDSKHGAILDTLARVHYWRGELERAIQLQVEAVAVAKGDLREVLEEVLEDYRQTLREKQSGKMATQQRSRRPPFRLLADR